MKPYPSSIFVSRTDNIGDVILTIPITYALRQKFPKIPIYFICSEYTYPILRYVQTIDIPIVYTQLHQVKNQLLIDNHSYAVLVYPTYEMAKLLYTLKIPYRVGTSHRWYNWLYCNERIHFSRKNSHLHEAQLNFKLLKPFDITDNVSLNELVNYYQLKPISSLSSHLKNFLDSSKIKVILHPKSKGSAREWGIKNFIALIKNLDTSKYQIIITGTKNEGIYLKDIFTECSHVLNFTGKTTLEELISLIKECDALVANSTGVLHVAAMLGKLSIGLFPSIKPMHPERWAPIGKNAHYLSLKKECNDCKKTPNHCHCIQSISFKEVLSLIETIK